MLRTKHFTMFGRQKARILRALLHLPRILASIWGVRLFRRPFALLGCYFKRTCPETLSVEMQSGYRIRLTGDVDDLAVLLSIFGRRDYGRIPEGGVVIDIGAHLGSFSLYAMREGAGRVYAYEPDPDLYLTFQTNLRENGLVRQVEANQAAVIGSRAEYVAFCPEGNASGHVGGVPEEGPEIMVRAETLAGIVVKHRIEYVDLLKLDCEGSEYGIIFETPEEIWDRIGSVRLEYHKGRADEIERRFRELGFRLSRRVNGLPGLGLMWFEKPVMRKPACWGEPVCVAAASQGAEAAAMEFLNFGDRREGE
jgi:FkbM family methyltransferase